MNWRILPSSEFDAIAPAWDAVNASNGGVPVLDSTFVRALLASFSQHAWTIGVCEEGDAPIALGILMKEGFGHLKVFHPSQGPIGAWVQKHDEPLERLASGLLRASGITSSAIAITQQDPDLVPRPADSETIETLDYIATARVPITGTFEAYWEARGKNLRHNMRRQRARLEQEGVALHLDVITRPEDVAEALVQYGKLEGAGWKAAAGTAVTAENDQGLFYTRLLEAYCAAGRGRIYRLRYDDRVAAMDLCVEGNGTLVILKTSYDETIRDTSPAFLMRQQYFADLFADGRTRQIEFYGRLMEWHTRWSGDARTMYHANVYRSRAVARIHATLRSVRAGNANTPDTLPTTAPPPLDIEVTHHSSVDTLPAECAALFDAAAEDNPFLSLDWLKNITRNATHAGDEFHTWVAWQAGSPPCPVGALTMVHRKSEEGGGRQLSGLANYYTSLFGPALAAADVDNATILQHLVAAIADHRPRWDTIDLRPLDHDGPTYERLATALRKAGFLVQRYFCFGNWTHTLANHSYADYIASRPPRVGSVIVKRRKALERNKARLEIFTGPDDVDRAICDYLLVYNASWKQPEPFTAFVPHLIRTCAANGTLRLGLAYLNEEPIATQLWMVSNGVASIFKLAYDEKHKKHSAGTVLSGMLFEHVIEKDKVRVIDYLSGDDPYKQDWMTTRRERWGIMGFNTRTLRGLALAARHLGGTAARKLLRRGTGTLSARARGEVIQPPPKSDGPAG